MGSAFQMKVSSRGQVVLPGGLRKQVGLQGGDELSVQALDGRGLAAERREATSFETAMSRLRQEMEERGITQDDIDRAVEEVKQEIHDEVYGSAAKMAA